MKVAKLTDYYFRWDFITGTSLDGALRKFVRDKYTIWDADNCGNRTYHFAIGEDGAFKFYEVSHSWGWENFGKEDSYLANEFEFREITESEARKTVKKWMVV